jgi:hypothetical protein
MAEALRQAGERAWVPGPREARPPPVRPRRPPAARLALLYGGYLLVTGLWPLVHFRSFVKVTGPKRDGWLTKVMGACLANIGAVLLAAGARGRVARELRLLGGGVALALAAADFHYAGVRRRISPIYLLDGVAELAIVAGWIGAEAAELTAARRRPEAAFA